MALFLNKRSLTRDFRCVLFVVCCKINNLFTIISEHNRGGDGGASLCCSENLPYSFSRIPKKRFGKLVERSESSLKLEPANIDYAPLAKIVPMFERLKALS